MRAGTGLAPGTTLTNSATVGSSTPDPNGSNNNATATSTVAAQADLSVTKTVDRSPLVAGLEAVYTLTVHNAGPSDAVNPKVVDTLPPGVTFVSATTAAGTCSGTAVVSCSRPSLAADADWTIEVRVKVLPGTTAPQTDQVVVSSDTPDPANGNDQTSLTTPVSAAGDLAVVKTRAWPRWSRASRSPTR